MEIQSQHSEANRTILFVVIMSVLLAVTDCASITVTPTSYSIHTPEVTPSEAGGRACISTIVPTTAKPKSTATSVASEAVPTKVWATRRDEFFDTTGLELGDIRCIDHCVSHPTNLITLGQFIEAAGPPERAYSTIDGPSNSFGVVLIYERQGMVINAYRGICGNTSDATQEMTVEQIALFRSRTLDAMGEEMDELGMYRIYLDATQVWTGFGRVKGYNQ
jgi:hypothetical protein